MIDLRDIHPLSEFPAQRAGLRAAPEATGRPEVLTVHGQAEIVVQLADAYQRLLDLAANAAAIVGVQRGLQGMIEGTRDDAEDAFRSLEGELGIPERS